MKKSYIEHFLFLLVYKWKKGSFIWKFESKSGLWLIVANGLNRILRSIKNASFFNNYIANSTKTLSEVTATNSNESSKLKYH